MKQGSGRSRSCIKQADEVMDEAVHEAVYENRLLLEGTIRYSCTGQRKSLGR
jgi:hypothetical protein